MNATLIKNWALAALAVAAVSCAKEQTSPNVDDGQEVNVAFNIAAPSALVTKAINDGQTAKNLTVAVYDDNNGSAGNHIATLDKSATFEKLKARVEFSLVKGKTYHFIFWAQSGTEAYKLLPEEKSVEIHYDGVANDESRDAFFATRSLKVTGALNETVELHRPFAQVNFGTADLEAAAKNGFVPTKSTFSLSANGAASLLKPFERIAEGGVCVNYTEAAIPTEKLVLNDEKKSEYDWLAMNYFIPKGKLDEQQVCDFKATFVTDANEAVEISVPAAPVQANYRTNIVGNLLTDQVIFNVVIDPNFDGKEDIDLITSVVALKALFANGGTAVLAEDIDLDETVSVAAGKEVVLDLNGKSISNSSDIWDEIDGSWSLLSVKGGTLTIIGDGKLQAKEDDCYAVDVQDGGELIINGGEYIGNIVAVYVETGKATINGGTYSIQQTNPTAGKEYEFVLNNLDANYKAGTATITVTGGKFEKFNPGNCKAEGENTNFLADGYKSTQDGDYYVVSKE